MPTLDVISELTGDRVGGITLDDGRVTLDGGGRGIWPQYRKFYDTDQECFDLLAQGYSNGYVTIPALEG